jgi:ABC-type nitrate/sulfonate/bicarbonate transport system permease component
VTTLAAQKGVRVALIWRAVPSWVSGLIRTIIAFGGVIALWLLSTRIVNQPITFYPTPASVWHSGIVLWQHGLLPSDIQVSVIRWLLGVGLGLCVALPLALLMSVSVLMRNMFMPTLNFFYAIVEIAWIPLFVLWFGFSTATLELSISYPVFFLVLYNTIAGISQVPQVTVNAARTMGASRWQIARHVVLPGALPNIIAGFRLGASFGWRALIAAEIIAAQSGLGYLIYSSEEALQTSRIIVGMIVIGLLWLFVDRLYLRPLEIATVERWGLVRR